MDARRVSVLVRKAGLMALHEGRARTIPQSHALLQALDRTVERLVEETGGFTDESIEPHDRDVILAALTHLELVAGRQRVMWQLRVDGRMN